MLIGAVESDLFLGRLNLLLDRDVALQGLDFLLQVVLLVAAILVNACTRLVLTV